MSRGYSGSTWAFSEDRQGAVEREQNALKTLESADPAFAKAITAKLIPDRTEHPDTILSQLDRHVTRGRK